MPFHKIVIPTEANNSLANYWRSGGTCFDDEII